MSAGRITIIIMMAVLTALVVVLAVSQRGQPPPGEKPRADLERKLERLRSLPYATATPEKKIKKRGIKRFLEDNQFGVYHANSVADRS